MAQEARVAVRIWDLPTRLFHWALVVLVVASFVTGEFNGFIGADALEWHKRSGLAILGLLLFRLLWGFVGGTHARFASFLRGPGEIGRYARQLAAGGGAEAAGHNPLGGWSVVALLVALAVQVGTGLFLVQEDFAFEAPLARHVSRAATQRLNEIHEVNFAVLATLVALHVAAVVFYAVVKRQNLVGAMISGRKRLEAGRESEASRNGGAAAATVVALLAAAAVWALVALA